MTIEKCKPLWPLEIGVDIEPPDNEWFIEQLKRDNISFDQLYYGNWETDKQNPCNGCSNKGKVCHCTIGSPLIY